MDTWTAPALARRLGVSLPTMHRILDREGVPRTSRGVPRAIPDRIAGHLVWSHAPRLRPEATRVLAALRSRHLGIESARKVASVAAVSPTTAAKALRRFVETGLVHRADTRTISGGRVTRRRVYLLNTKHSDWPSIRSAVDSVALPQLGAEKSDVVPQRFWHMFWNADPLQLRVREHGAFIARRLLNGSDVSAATWALENVPEDLIVDAVSGRGVDERTRTFALNYVKSA